MRSSNADAVDKRDVAGADEKLMIARTCDHSGGVAHLAARVLSLLLSALLLSAAKRPLPQGELVLDSDHPVVDATLAGVPVRLRVDLAHQDAIELNPETAARLAVKWEGAVPTEVGRVLVSGREAIARLQVAGVALPVLVAEHGRACCADADGAVPPGLLPYAVIRWRRPAAPEPTATRYLPLFYTPETGYVSAAPGGPPKLRIRFDAIQRETIATASAGALLAREWGGAWDGPSSRTTMAFGVERPIRRMRFDKPGTLAGFALPSLAVRLADFGGHERLPTDAALPGDIVVRHRYAPQHGWPMVTLGADRLDRCREIAFTAQPLGLSLSCDFAS